MDKNGNGIGSRKDTYRLIKKYNRIVSCGVNVVKLIRQCDRNRDNVLGTSEVHELLKVRAPTQINGTAAQS